MSDPLKNTTSLLQSLRQPNMKNPHALKMASAKHCFHLLLLFALLTPSLSTCPSHLYLAIGSVTLFPDAPGEGITLVVFRNNALSKLAILHPNLTGENPTFLASSLPYLYATNGNSTQGALRQIKLPHHSPYLWSRSVATDGGGVAHVSILESWLGHLFGIKHIVMTANFMGGSVNSFLSKGRVLKKADVFRVSASLAARNRHPELSQRQAEPRPHMVLPYRKGVLVPDLGSDFVFYLEASVLTGKLREISRTLLGKGDGPRHGVLHTKSNAVYIVNEISNSVVVLREKGEGQFKVESRWELLMNVGEEEVVTAAAIRVSVDGRFLYVSVRIRGKTGRIVGFELDDNDGKVEKKIGIWSSGGQNPRDFYLVERVVDRGKCRSFLAVANRDSSNLVLIERNSYNGKLKGVRHKLKIQSPMSVLQYL